MAELREDRVLCRVTDNEGVCWTGFVLDTQGRRGTPASGLWFHSTTGRTRFAPFAPGEHLTPAEANLLSEEAARAIFDRSEPDERRRGLTPDTGGASPTSREPARGSLGAVQSPRVKT
jgi:hypothetical protein